jgi:hypothetical protein
MKWCFVTDFLAFVVEFGYSIAVQLVVRHFKLGFISIAIITLTEINCSVNHFPPELNWALETNIIAIAVSVIV